MQVALKCVLCGAQVSVSGDDDVKVWMRSMLSSYTPGVTLFCFVFTAGLTLGRCAEWVVHCVL